MGFTEWLARVIDHLSGLDAQPAGVVAGGSIDAIGLVVDAVMAEAGRRNTGKLLILPDTVTLSLPGGDYEYWNGLQHDLCTQIEDQVGIRARRAARTLGGGKEIRGGTIRLILLQSADANAVVRVQRRGNVERHEVDYTRGPGDLPMTPDARPRELAMSVAGRAAGSTLAVAGTQIGRDPASDLVIPDDQAQTSRIAATVLATRTDAINLRVDNRYGAWLRDEAGQTSTIRSGRNVLLRPGQCLYLDADARTTLTLT